LEKEILFAEKIQDIIDAKNTPADLNKIMEECKHLDSTEQRVLLQIANPSQVRRSL
jgi:hypothetical protein